VLQTRYAEEKGRNDSVEHDVTTRVKSRHERLLTELKSTLTTCQEDLRIAQSKRDDTDSHYLVQIKSLQEKISAQSLR